MSGEHNYISEQLRQLAVPIASLKPDVANARKHGERNMDAIVASLDRWGQRLPIVVQREGMIVRAGNGRMEAAKRLGWTHIAAVIVDDTSVDAVAYAIADNRTAELAEWDGETLAALLKSLPEEDVGDTGFTDEDIKALLDDLTPDAEVQEDEVPDPPLDPITKPGDLWVLGDHRLLCGDSTKAEDVGRLMNGMRADLWLTDPPYNVDYTGKTAGALKVANDSMGDSEFRAFLSSCFALAFDAIKPGASFYIWHADSEGYNFRGAVCDCKQKVRQCLIWVKQTMVMGRQDYQWKHEPCLYGWREGASHGWYADRKQTTVLQFDRPSRSEEHPTMKPVAMFAYLVGNSTAPQGLVYDPFLGSGTTLIASDQLGRKCYGMEISPQYCDVIVKRWENLTGKKAHIE